MALNQCLERPFWGEFKTLEHPTNYSSSICSAQERSAKKSKTNLEGSLRRSCSDVSLMKSFGFGQTDKSVFTINEDQDHGVGLPAISKIRVRISLLLITRSVMAVSTSAKRTRASKRMFGADWRASAASIRRAGSRSSAHE